MTELDNLTAERDLALKMLADWVVAIGRCVIIYILYYKPISNEFFLRKFRTLWPSYRLRIGNLRNSTLSYRTTKESYYKIKEFSKTRDRLPWSDLVNLLELV